MPNKPNILFITSDQHRADYTGCYGHPQIDTTHLDRLSMEGMCFDRAYSDCPVCIPARTTIITGLQSHRYGMPAYNADYRIARRREDFLGSLMTKAGYQTQLVGKTHWHTESSFRAGFEHVCGYDRLHEARQRIRPYGSHGLGGNECNATISPWPRELHSTDWVIDRSIEFLRHRDETQPFFLWSSMIDPHPPLAIHEPYHSMYFAADIPPPLMPDWCCPEQEPAAHHHKRLMYNPWPKNAYITHRARAAYMGMITNLDHQLGRLFGELLRQNEWDNTVVIYTTDHGELLGDYGAYSKSSFLDAAARLPFIVRLPQAMRESHGIEPGRRSTALVELADLLPTFCELADTEAPSDISGQSLVPLLHGRQEHLRDDWHGQINNSHVYHDGRYKLLYDASDGRCLVFDMDTDPQELSNLAGDTALTDRLKQALLTHLQQEGHEHAAGNSLRNEGWSREADHKLRARNPMGLRSAIKY